MGDGAKSGCEAGLQGFGTKEYRWALPGKHQGDEEGAKQDLRQKIERGQRTSRLKRGKESPGTVGQWDDPGPEC